MVTVAWSQQLIVAIYISKEKIKRYLFIKELLYKKYFSFLL